MCSIIKSKSAGSTPQSSRCSKNPKKMELLKQMHAGDKTARDKLVNGNLRLVLSVIQRFVNRGENLDDLFKWAP